MNIPFNMLGRGKIVLLFLVMDFSLSAQNPGASKGFYCSFNMGPGLVHGNITSVETKTTVQFAMHFSVGYFFKESVQVGITGWGWLFEPYRWTPTEVSGESVANTMLHIQVYPSRKYRLYFKGGYGMSTYTNWSPGKDYGQGMGFIAATGYEDFISNKELLWGVQLSYQYGMLQYGNLYTPENQRDRKFEVLDFTLFIGLD
jgi:hypothetical protein